MPTNISWKKENTTSIKPLNTDNIEKVINDVKKVIINENYHSLVLDLSEFNLFNSIRIGTIIATYHFINFINGKIVIIVQDKLAKKMIENFKLKNATIVMYQESKSVINIA